MEEEHKNTLEDIFQHGGHCQNGINCRKCPFFVEKKGALIHSYVLCGLLEHIPAELKLQIIQKLLGR